MYVPIEINMQFDDDAHQVTVRKYVLLYGLMMPDLMDRADFNEKWSLFESVWGGRSGLYI